jgi:Skp family chaperone for outer membrane proteins
MPTNDYVVKCKVEEIIKVKADTLYKTIDAAKKFKLDAINQDAFDNDADLKKLKTESAKVYEENRKLAEKLNKEKAAFDLKQQEESAKGKAKMDGVQKRIGERTQDIKQKISADVSKTEMSAAELRTRVQEKMTKAHETLWVAGAGQELKDVLSQVPTIDELRNDGLRALINPDQMHKLLLGMAAQPVGSR